MTYSYRDTRTHLLREGDEIRAADGTSWLSPIRPSGIKRVRATGYGGLDIYEVWTDTKPGYGPADHQLFDGQHLRVRTWAVPPTTREGAQQ